MKPLNNDQVRDYVSLLADDVDDDHLLLSVLILALAYIDEADGRRRFKNYLVGTLKGWQGLVNEVDGGVEFKRVRRRALENAIKFAESLPEFDPGPPPAWPEELPQQFDLVNVIREPGPKVETRSLGNLTQEQWDILGRSSINRRPFLWNGERLELKEYHGRDGNDGLWYDVKITVVVSRPDV